MMSPAGTMARVYQALKTRVMTGSFAPGERIDPARLSDELAASATPIRDALHRLAGERLVESWQQEGFRQPFLTEAALRDLYTWSDDVARAALRATEHHPADPGPAPSLESDDLASTAALTFQWLARHSSNAEHLAVMTSLGERLHLVRRAESRLFGASPAELDELIVLLDRREWGQARRWSAGYHSRRLRRLPDLVAALARRDG